MPARKRSRSVRRSSKVASKRKSLRRAASVKKSSVKRAQRTYKKKVRAIRRR